MSTCSKSNGNVSEEAEKEISQTHYPLKKKWGSRGWQSGALKRKKKETFTSACAERSESESEKVVRKDVKRRWAKHPDRN